MNHNPTQSEHNATMANVLFQGIALLICYFIAGPIDKAGKGGIIGYLVIASLLGLWMLANLLGVYQKRKTEGKRLNLTVLLFILLAAGDAFIVVYSILRLNAL